MPYYVCVFVLEKSVRVTRIWKRNVFKEKKLNIQFENGVGGRNKKGRRNDRRRRYYTGAFVRETRFDG